MGLSSNRAFRRVSDGHKASAYLLESMTDPRTAFSHEPTHAPFQRAFQIDVGMYAWHERPEQEYRRKRFSLAMSGRAVFNDADLLAGKSRSLSLGGF